MTTLRITPLTGAALEAEIDALARLRIAVFRAWPYLYDGDMGYERDYVRHYITSADALIVGAFDGNQLVGAATAAPLLDHADEFETALVGKDIDMARTFYCGESVLLPAYRGQGVGHRFFDLREAYARAKGYAYMCFCAVTRPADHPARPSGYVPLDGFWEKRGYAPVPGAIARFGWKDVGADAPTDKPLQFWMRSIAP